MEKNKVLCASSNYDKKYYFNEEFQSLPVSIQEEIKITSVLFTEEVGGVFTMCFDEEGNLELQVVANEEDILYDEIGSALKIKEIQRMKTELLEALELYYKVFFCGEKIEMGEEL